MLGRPSLTDPTLLRERLEQLRQQPGHPRHNGSAADMATSTSPTRAQMPPPPAVAQPFERLVRELARVPPDAPRPFDGYRGQSQH